MNLAVETAEFPNGNQARLLRVSGDARPADIFDALDLPPPRAVVILNGGTAALDPTAAAQLGRALQDGLARFAAAEQLVVLTGATDAGIFRLLGEGFRRFGRPAACVGVAVAALVTWGNGARPDGLAPLEPHHSHFVLTEGRDWGDETGIMYALAAEWAAVSPTVAVFASGGEIARREMLVNVEQGRPMILLRGSGRLTDDVLKARAGQLPLDERLAQIAAYDQISVYDIGEPPEALAGKLRRRLWG